MSRRIRIHTAATVRGTEPCRPRECAGTQRAKARMRTSDWISAFAADSRCGPIPVRARHSAAAATARRASTPTRWARYSALPWMSLVHAVGRDGHAFERLRRRSASSAPPRTRSRGTRRSSRRRSRRRGSRSRAWTRTRRPAHSARPGWGISRRPPCSGSGNCTLVMISSSSSAVSNRPLKKSSAAMRRLLVMMVAPSPRHAGRIIGVRIVVGDRAADRAAMAHRRIADQAGEMRRAPGWPPSRPARSRPRHAASSRRW